MIQLNEAYPIEQITEGDRVRAELGEIELLAETIREKGLLQPLTIDTRGVLVMGGRRLAACRLAGLTHVPVIIRPYEDELDHREIELIENVHRKDLTWQEHLKSVTAIHNYCLEKYGADWWSKRKTAKLLGMSPSTFTELEQAQQMVELVPEAAEGKGHREVRKIAKRQIEATLLKRLAERLPSGNQTQSLYNAAGNHYLIGDCRQGLADLTPDVWNFAEVDPPYAVDIQKLRLKSELRKTYTEVAAEEYGPFIREVAEPLYRALAENSFAIWWFPILHYQLVRTGLEAVGFKVDNVPAIWYKANSSVETNDPNTLLASSWEPFFILRKGQPAIKQRGRSNVFAYPGVPTNNRGHLAERPVPLLLEILDTFTWPGARVLVPFLGSGNTLLACYERQFVGLGWDLEPSYREYFLTNVARRAVESFNG